MFAVIRSIQDGFSGFLKQVLSLIRLLHPHILQKPLTVNSVDSELRSIRRIKLSCLEKTLTINTSFCLFISLRWFEVKFLFGL